MITWLETQTLTPPAIEPVDDGDVWNWLHLDPETDDGTLALLIPSARGHVEAHTGTRLISQSVTFYASGFCDGMRLPLAPVSGIDEIRYLDADGVAQVLSSAVYDPVLRGLDPVIVRAKDQEWPETYSHPGAVMIDATVGYGAGKDDVPAPVRQAIILLLAGWFANRESVNVGNIVNVMPFGVDILLANHRRFGF